MKRQIRAGGRWVAQRVAPTAMDSVSRIGTLAHAVEQQGGELAALRTRVAELEQEVQECRRLNRRVAELVDVVEEVLVPATERDEEKLRRRLAGYAQEM